MGIVAIADNHITLLPLAKVYLYHHHLVHLNVLFMIFKRKARFMFQLYPLSLLLV